MRNLPYANQHVKAQAQKLVRKSHSRRSSIFSLWYVLVLPVAVYFLAQPSGLPSLPFMAPFIEVVKTQVEQLKDRLQPELEKTNAAITETAEENSSVFQQLKQIAPAPAIVPAAGTLGVRALAPTNLGAQESQAAVDGFNNLPMDFAVSTFSKDDLLNDKYNRIPDVFRIPSNLRKRVGFWLDIYSRYHSRYHVIHHSEFPWIIYKVVDTTPIYEGPGHKWTKYHRAQSAAKKAIAQVRADLMKLSRMKRFDRLDKLTEEQRRYVELFSEIPGPRNRIFARAANHVRSQLGQKDFFKNGIVSGSKYLPSMEEIFAQYDLPVELTRLPLVESSFNENAISKVGASGIWQFMPTVGKNYLKINTLIDEKNSPQKATEAAAKLMLSNFRMLKNWPLAITAYNHGPNGLRRAQNALRTDDLAVIIDRWNTDRFGFASSNFFASFLAALHAERYQEQVFGDLQKAPAHRSESLLLGNTFKAGELISIAGITMEELRLFNKDLKARSINSNTRLPKGYRVFLPQGRKARIEMYLMEQKEASRMKSSARQALREQKRLQVYNKSEARGRALEM